MFGQELRLQPGTSDSYCPRTGTGPTLAQPGEGKDAPLWLGVVLWPLQVTKGAGCLGNCQCWLLSVMTSKDVERAVWTHRDGRQEEGASL